MNLDFAAASQTFVGGELLKGRDNYEPEVVELLLRLLDIGRGKPQIFIDVGGNIGYFPLVACRHAASAELQLDCFAHEPLPQLAEVAKALQHSNGIKYTLSSKALSDFIGDADFYVSSKSDASNSLVKGFRPEKEVITVKVTTMDAEYADLIRNGNYGQVTLMIDVETAEPAVLNGARNIIETHRPWIICEVLAGRTERALATFFAEVDYRPFMFDGSRWVEQSELHGDTSHRFRDWLFVPRERVMDFVSST